MLIDIDRGHHVPTFIRRRGSKGCMRSWEILATCFNTVAELFPSLRSLLSSNSSQHLQTPAELLINTDACAVL